jgi:lysozyme
MTLNVFAADEPLVVAPPLPWSLSENGVRFIMANESLRLKAYPDSAGIWTIGYGSTHIEGVPVQPGDMIGPEQAARCLRKDCRRFVTALQRLVTQPLTQPQIDALTDFMYNVGGSSFASSTLRKIINAGKPVTQDLFTRWNKVHDAKTGQLVVVPGLTARRNREFALYNS